jgi:hypothetical protein
MEDADYFTPALNLLHQGGGNFGLFTKSSSLDYGGLLALRALRSTSAPEGIIPLIFPLSWAIFSRIDLL